MRTLFMKKIIAATNDILLKLLNNDLFIKDLNFKARRFTKYDIMIGLHFTDKQGN